MLGSIFFSLFLFAGITFLLAIAFCIWLVAIVIGGIASAISWMVRGGRPALPRRAQSCPRMRCGQTNPPGVRYCRRCGGDLLSRERFIPAHINQVHRFT